MHAPNREMREQLRQYYEMNLEMAVSEYFSLKEQADKLMGYSAYVAYKKVMETKEWVDVLKHGAEMSGFEVTITDGTVTVTEF